MKWLVGLLLIQFQFYIQASDIPSGYRQVASHYGIPTKVFYAIALQESSKKWPDGRVLPWPWTLNIARKGYRYDSFNSACVALIRSIRMGKSTDIGAMQIHWQSHRSRLPKGTSPCVLLKPKNNLVMAAIIFREQYERSKNVWKAVGHYHHPSKEKYAQRYRKLVWRRYRRLS